MHLSLTTSFFSPEKQNISPRLSTFSRVDPHGEWRLRTGAPPWLARFSCLCCLDFAHQKRKTQARRFSRNVLRRRGISHALPGICRALLATCHALQVICHALHEGKMQLCDW